MRSVIKSTLAFIGFAVVLALLLTLAYRAVAGRWIGDDDTIYIETIEPTPSPTVVPPVVIVLDDFNPCAMLSQVISGFTVAQFASDTGQLPNEDFLAIENPSEMEREAGQDLALGVGTAALVSSACEIIEPLLEPAQTQ